jgi:hypothetical protein
LVKTLWNQIEQLQALIEQLEIRTKKQYEQSFTVFFRSVLPSNLLTEENRQAPGWTVWASGTYAPKGGKPSPYHRASGDSMTKKETSMEYSPATTGRKT